MDAERLIPATLKGKMHQGRPPALFSLMVRAQQRAIELDHLGCGSHPGAEHMLVGIVPYLPSRLRRSWKKSGCQEISQPRV